MPRKARVDAPHRLHHLIARCLNREFLLFGPEARAEYLRRLATALASVDTRLLGYALMSNHIHLACLTGEAPLSRLILPAHGGFAQWLNRQLGRLGPVFAGRFTDIVCPLERTDILLAYQSNNPVRAKLVLDAADSDWTSHRAYVGLTEAPPWLDVELGLALIGLDASPAGRAGFHELVRSRAVLGRDPLLSGDDERATRRYSRAISGADSDVGGAVLLPDLERVERELLVVPGAAVRPRWPGGALAVVDAVARQCGVDADEVRSRNRRRDIVEVRRAALRLWTRGLGRAQTEMVGVLGLSASAGSQLLQKPGSVSRATMEQLAESLWAPLRQEPPGAPTFAAPCPTPPA